MATKKPSPPRRKAATKTSAGTTPAEAVEQAAGETGASPSRASGLGAEPDMQPADSAEGPAYGADMRDAIAQRAYAIWEREGRPEGRHDEHWEQAEREVLVETSGQSAR